MYMYSSLKTVPDNWSRRSSFSFYHTDQKNRGRNTPMHCASIGTCGDMPREIGSEDPSVKIREC